MTTTTEPAIVAFIPEAAFERLDVALARVNRQAIKLGLAPVYYERTGRTEMRPVPGAKPQIVAGEVIRRVAKWDEIAVWGEQPKLPGGWKLLGAVDHREALPIVNAVPGCSLPAGQRERGPVCDHCGKRRKRVETFVLRAEDGRVVQVGRQCIGDFLGLSDNDPAHALTWWIALRAKLGLGDSDELGFEGMARGREMIEVGQVVLLAAAAIDEWGWISRGRAEQTHEQATASRLSWLLWPPSFQASERTRNAWAEDWAAIELRLTAALKAERDQALAWAAAPPPEGVAPNDYRLNLAVVARCEAVGSDKLGLVASLIASYRREQDTLRDAERKRKAGASSVYVGKPKDRLAMTLTLVDRPRAFGYDSDRFATTSYRCEFHDEHGNVIVWWASNDPTVPYRSEWAIGEAKRVKATVKKHSEWKGVKQTVVTRVTPL